MATPPLTNSGESSWPELLGKNNWAGLLDPLNLDLRRLILRCGDFVQATYDAFNNDENSRFAGSSRYGKRSFFRKVMLEGADDYEVSSFLYATAKLGFTKALFLHSLSRESWDRESNWIGYIAVTSDSVSAALGRREIYVAFRGTTRNYEWIDVLGARPESAKQLMKQSNWEKKKANAGDSSDEEDDGKTAKIMKGWLTIYLSSDPKSEFTKLSARSQLLKKIQRLREQHAGESLSITLTGHSLGASLAIVAAFDLVENGVADIPVAAIVFGSPQVGNGAFKRRVEKFPNLKILHVRNKIDVIPHYPGRVLGYAPVGVEFQIDNRKSPSLKHSKNPSDWHNLQAMLHTVAGWNGEKGEFELKVKRSAALVNKSAAILNDELLIPGSWWIEKNKGMILDENGDWVLSPPADEDMPTPEF
ncbi:hypothetical protein M569_09564 [Genlisea aurea]|uniref:Phospholipase A1 n=1 Tax=Genlisea aurea TaxID=192259 RepID=S8CKJ3_9LAMI|nr:hypothetical protein M569_09564 [Genlisea aurea]